MLHNLWLERLEDLKNYGYVVGPRGLQTKEQVDVTDFVFDSDFNVLDVPERRLNYRFMVAEWIWMSFGMSAVEPLAHYNSKMRDFSDDGVFLAGAYGPHIGAQKFGVLQKLKDDPATRQAVIEIPRVRRTTKDEPCTLSLQYLNRHGALHGIVTMRSSDAWLGLPYDAFTFAQIMSAFAGELGLQRGWLSMHLGSSHLYEVNESAADELLQLWAEGKLTHADTMASPALPGWPPYWLADVLMRRSGLLIPSDAQEPWLTYARVLLSDDNREAVRLLRDATVVRPRSIS